MDDERKHALGLAHDEASEETSEGREVYLQGGRTLRVASQGSEELVEIRAASGQLELRIRLTEQGPVLQMEAVRLQLKASEAVELEARQVTVKAEDKLTLGSEGELRVESKGETQIEAEGDVRVVGKTIHLN